MSNGTKSTICILDVVACGIELFVCISLIAVMIFSSTIFKKLSEFIPIGEQPEINRTVGSNEPTNISTPLPSRMLPTPTPLLTTYGGTIGYVPQDVGRWVVAEYWGYERNYPQVQYQWVQVQR